MKRHPHVNAISSPKEYTKFFGILVLLAATATLMSTTVSFDWLGWTRWFIGGFFLVFGSFKLIGYDMFVTVFRRYDSLARRYSTYAHAFPILQVVLGVCYILNVGGLARDVLTFVIMARATVSVFHSLTRYGPTVHAVCLNNVLKLPLSTVLLFEDVILTAATAYMVIGTVLT